jgi:ParB-like chromosome segregation protein Spo0J
MVNYNDIFKPILIAKFEESPYFLVLDGNHRLAAAVLLRQRYINAFFVDARESFL